jgi:hypothetical protein
MERGSFAARHDFDALPLSPDVDVRRAKFSEIAALSQLAHRLVPGVRIGATELAKYFAFDPESILTFSRKGNLVGGMAFLFLNDRGHDALLLDERPRRKTFPLSTSGRSRRRGAASPVSARPRLILDS